MAFLLGLLAVTGLNGCALPTGLLNSRWAMDNAEYGEKYAEGVPKGDWLGKLKQASDARFIRDKVGAYASVGIRSRNDSNSAMLGGDFGFEKYVTSFYTGRISFSGVSDFDGFRRSNADLGLRLQLPSRFAPFLGVGGLVGTEKERPLAEHDGADNDGNGLVDEPGERLESHSRHMAAAYPEFGAHFWWTPRVRFTGFGRYLLTTEGRDQDDWWFGAGIAVFSK